MIRAAKQSMYILLCIVCIQCTLSAQSVDRVKFRTLPSGISNNLVSYIYQDSRGFMWFGTSNGLNKFNGYQYTIYEHSSSDSTSISRNTITHIHEEGKTGNLWISTEGGGLSYFDRKKEKFKTYTQGNDEQHLSSNIIRMVCEDTDGRLWIAHSLGLDCLNPQTGIVQHFSSNQSHTNYTAGDAQSIFRVDKDAVWLGSTVGGLVRFDKKTKTFDNFTTENSKLADNFTRVISPSVHKDKYWVGYQKAGVSLISIQNNQIVFEKHFAHEDNNPNSIAGNNIKSLLEDSKGNLWIGIENVGISKLNPKTNTVAHYIPNTQEKYSLSSNSTWSIYEDKFKNIWIGTYNQGVNVVYNKYYDNFEHYQQQNDDNSIPNNNVSCFIEHNHKIWIGTDGGGISVWDREKEIFTNYDSKSSPPFKLSEDAIISVCKDPQGNLWFGTWEGGINVLNAKTQDFSYYTIQNQGLASNTHFDLTTGKDGHLYLLSWENTLEAFDVAQQKVMWSKEITQNNVNLFYRILEDSHQNLWIATVQGLILIDKENRHAGGKVKVFLHQKNKKNSLSDSRINDIYEDSKGNIWIGTINGLNKYLPKTQAFKSYLKKDGLVDEDIKAIIEDNQQFLWITTGRGVSRFDLEKETFENYQKEDGLQGSEFSRGAIYKTQKGEILMGGKNGFNIFDPKALIKNPYLPEVFFTHFKIFNEPIKVQDKNSPLSQSIESIKEITLNHTQSVFTIEYVALNYTRPEKNQYAYFLEGFDKKWNYVGDKREATYTNLPPGKYTFRVRASNNDGIWNPKEAKIEIIILPPWWNTLWFRSLIVCVILGLAFTFYKIRTDFLKKQNQNLEKQVEERTKEVMAQNEELRQNQEEILSQRDFIQTQNDQLSKQNKIVRETSRQIRQSINAALTIQQAILPHHEKIAQLLGEEHFLIYKPKDVVSGDFYWLNQIEEKTVCVVADCTGHGVPGAFMTIIGDTLLDKIVKMMKITQPAKILEQLHQEIFKGLKQKHTKNNYGMDAVIITIESVSKDKSKISFAGAKNPLYYADVRYPEKIERLTGTRKSIGGKQNDSISFAEQEIILSRGSIIYMTTDGYGDQNNVKRKRFGENRFVETLSKISQLPLAQQQQILEEKLNEFMANTTQRDDILTIGFKI